MVIRQGIARTGLTIPLATGHSRKAPPLLILLLRIVHALHFMGPPGHMPAWKMGQCRIPIEYLYEDGTVFGEQKAWHDGVWYRLGRASLEPDWCHAPEPLPSKPTPTEGQRIRLFQLLYRVLAALSPCIQVDSWRHTRYRWRPQIHSRPDGCMCTSTGTVLHRPCLRKRIAVRWR